MSERQKDIIKTKAQDIREVDKKNSEFQRRTIRLNAIASNILNNENFDIEKADRESKEGLKALGAKGGLQEMLIAQMLSIHQLQQISMVIANNSEIISNKQYFTSTAIKLANTFVQQANFLSRIQGIGGQKIIVERVDVHNGGQAIVGSINGGMPTDKEKK